MSMMRKLFVPGAGQTLASYIAAVAEGVMYPGDLVSLSPTVPTSQGVSGVFRGQTLALTDFIECELSDAAVAGSEGNALGFLHGKTINAPASWEDVSAHALADGDVAIIQSWGVHPQAAQLDTGLIGEHLAVSATPGEAGNSATIAGCDVGVNMVASSTYTRVSAADTHGAVAFVRVGG
jgi:hypothetical protein